MVASLDNAKQFCLVAAIGLGMAWQSGVAAEPPQGENDTIGLRLGVAPILVERLAPVFCDVLSLDGRAEMGHLARPMPFPYFQADHFAAHNSQSGAGTIGTCPALLG